MRLTRLDRFFVFECNMTERFPAKKAGFVWNYFLPSKWATPDPKVACQLIEWADDTCYEDLRMHKMEFDKTIAASRQTSSDFPVSCPANLSPLPFQRAGVKFILEHHSTLLADEMGLGKTVQAVLALNCLGQAAYPCLIVCPAVLKINWKREIERWTRVSDKRSVAVVNGKSDKPDADITIVNYDILVRNEEWLHSTKWAVVIADEAHAIKTPGAKRTKSFSKIKAERKIIITGTPILNRPCEIYPILRYLDPVKWSNWAWFTQRYCGAHATRFGFDVSGASNLDELNIKLRSSVMIRRQKSEVLTELPPKFRQVIEMPHAEQSLVAHELEAYAKQQDIIVNLKAAVELAKASDNPDDYRAACAKLRDGISAGFAEMSKLRYQTAMFKVQPIVAHLEQAMENGPVICFAHHRDVINQIADKFNALRIMGDMDNTARQESVDSFQSPDSKDKLIVCSIKAAGVGITLTRSRHVVFAELDWTPAILSQCEDRAHRIGQTNNVLIQHFVLEGSLDAKMAKMLVQKQEVIDHVLDKDVLDEPVTPDDEPVSANKKQLTSASDVITVEDCQLSHDCIKHISSACDSASTIDGAGFSKVDAAIGKFLASLPTPSKKQYALMLRIAYKYRRQFSEDVRDRVTAAFNRCFEEKEKHANQDQVD